MRKRLLIPRAATLDRPWTNYTPPVGWTWAPLPFTIQQQGRKFRAAAFNLETYANISVTNTYYVSTTGDDGNTGLSWAQACRTLGGALGKANPDRIYIAAGYYYWNQAGSSANLARSMKIIGVGDVYLTSDVYNQMGAFALDGNHYEATEPTGLTAVFDHSIPGSDGFDSKLTKKTSEAEVDAAPGSWWDNAGTLYIRLADGRAPDSNVRYYYGSRPFRVARDSMTFYFENLNIHSVVGLQLGNASATGNLKCYLKNCNMRYEIGVSYNGLVVAGVTELILQGCKAEKNEADGFNYQAQNGVNPSVIEIDCAGQYNGSTSDHNVSSQHLGNVLRLNGRYHHSYGTNIHDVGATTLSLNLGVESYNPGLAGGASRVVRSNYSNGTAGSIMWLDSCASHDIIDTDLAEDVGGDMRYHNLNSGGQFHGTPTAY